MTASPVKCVALMGATATGKSALAVELALRFGGEVISMDSRQVYRGMDIGTGKVTLAEQAGVPHHLLDILAPDEAGSAGSHATLAREAAASIAAKGRVPILAGGTGLYFDALFRPLIDLDIPRERIDAIRARFSVRETLDLYAELRKIDPQRARELSPNDRVRITRALEIYQATGVSMSDHLARQSGSAQADSGFDFFKLVLTMPRAALRKRIEERTRAMYDRGWVNEVRALLEAGFRPEDPGMQSLGYEEIEGALRSGTDPDATIEAVITRTQQYAKRQETYFRREKDAVWLDVTTGGVVERAASLVRAFLDRLELT